MDQLTLDLTVMNRESVLFTGKVTSITSFNEKGMFDVLPEHSNFISILEKSLTYRTTDGQENTLPISNGIIKVNENKVEIFLGISQ